MDIKKMKKILAVLIIVGVLSIVLGVSMAFFNYTRTGLSNNLNVGRISFASNQKETIYLTNAYPITVTKDANGHITNQTGFDTLEIEITGDTDYSEGVEYLISSVNSNIYTSTGKLVPISLDVTVTNLGTENNNYFTAREGKNTTIYKKLVGGELVGDQMLLVGFIAPNNPTGTIAGINGKITIKAYLDDAKIGVSNTYDGTESDNMGSTNEWARGKTILTTEEWNSFSNSGISFKVKVEANEGIWVEEPLTSYTQIIRNVITPTTQINFGNISSASNGQGLYILPGTANDAYPIYYYRGAVTDNNVIFGGFCWQMVRTTDTGGIKMIYNGVATGDGKTCENTAHNDRIISSSAFNTNSSSVSDVGYMYNQRYPYTSGAAASNSIFGKAVEWDGTNYLVIEDTAGSASTNTTKDATHHYSCGTASTSSCVSVRYYYYNNYYITLTGGDTIEDALYKMTGNGSSTTKAKNASYVLNTTDSKAKTEIENWFKTNLTNEVDASKKNYQEYLEDTVYCNNRSYKTVTGSNPTYEQSGWNPNGGDITKHLYFGTWNRFKNSNWYSTTNVPSMECENVTDQFSVSNQEAKLKYPVGLLTADEIILAGAAGNSSANNSTYYLYTGGNYWPLSPSGFNYYYAYEFYVYNGYISNVSVIDSYGLRPVVSLKLGTEFEDGGEGTTLKPYVVKIAE